MKQLGDHFKLDALIEVKYLPLLLVIISLFILALLPEPHTRLLTKHDDWIIEGPVGSEVPLAAFPL